MFACVVVAVRNTGDGTAARKGVCPQRPGNPRVSHTRQAAGVAARPSNTRTSDAQGKTAAAPDSKDALDKREVCAFRGLPGRKGGCRGGRGSHETHNTANEHAVE